MTARRILFVVSQPPQRGALAREVLDAVLVAGVFEQRVAVLFIADGVYQLLDSGVKDANIARNYQALPSYDIDLVYVDRSALRQRRLAPGDLVLPVRVLGRAAIRRLLAAQDAVINDA
jgi:tRNA 2-thiouridine synthesizing protein C